MKPPIIKMPSKGVTLRPFKKGDDESFSRYVKDKAINRYTLRIPYPYTKSDGKKYITKLLKQQRSKDKLPMHFAIEIDREVVGIVGLNPTERDHKITIGYWLAKKHWGKGIMSAVVKKVSDFAFKKFKVKRICGYVFVQNEGSARVLEKAGFKYEGTLKKESVKNGKYIDEYLFAKVK